MLKNSVVCGSLWHDGGDMELDGDAAAIHHYYSHVELEPCFSLLMQISLCLNTLKLPWKKDELKAENIATFPMLIRQKSPRFRASKTTSFSVSVSIPQRHQQHLVLVHISKATLSFCILQHFLEKSMATEAELRDDDFTCICLF